MFLYLFRRDLLEVNAMRNHLLSSFESFLLTKNDWINSDSFQIENIPRIIFRWRDVLIYFILFSSFISPHSLSPFFTRENRWAFLKHLNRIIGIPLPYSPPSLCSECNQTFFFLISCIQSKGCCSVSEKELFTLAHLQSKFSSNGSTHHITLLP